MTPEEFILKRKKADKTQVDWGLLLKISRSSVQKYESGDMPIPEDIKLKVDEIMANLPREPIVLDVSKKNKISLEEAANFCLENEEEFRKITSVKMFLRVIKMEGFVEGKQEQIIEKIRKKNS